MTRKTRKPVALPQSGGRYIREADGKLKPVAAAPDTPVTAPPEKPAAKPVKSPVKEA